MRQNPDRDAADSEGAPAGPAPVVPHRPKRARDSVRHALDGILSGFHSQRHLRLHFLLGALALVAGVVWGLPRAELLVLTFAIALVIITELFNTAIEAAVDLRTTAYHPLAKLAKDIAAGAVLVAALNAVIVGLFLFLDVERLQALFLPEPRQPHPLHALVAAFSLVMVLLLVWKALGGRGRYLHGGVVSGHAALGFCLATVILLAEPENLLVGVLAIFLALLVSQSRVEAGVHSLREVLLGAALGVCVPVFIYKVLPLALALLGRL